MFEQIRVRYFGEMKMKVFARPLAFLFALWYNISIYNFEFLQYRAAVYGKVWFSLWKRRELVSLAQPVWLARDF